MNSIEMSVLTMAAIAPAYLLWAEEREARLANPEGATFCQRFWLTIKKSRWLILLSLGLFSYSIIVKADSGEWIVPVMLLLISMFWMISSVTDLLKRK